MVNDELPIGWVGTFLEEVAMWGSGGTPSRSVKEFFKGEIPWFKTGELTQKYIWESEEHISSLTGDKGARKLSE
jgi:type I restriction enzyme, S subunit